MNQQDSNGPSVTASDFDKWVKAVWQVVQGIPRGHVLTYGEVARLAGMSRAARRVSQAMRRAPREMKLPWHRVVNAQGKISFSEDSTGYRQQKRLRSSPVCAYASHLADNSLSELFWKK